MQTSTPEPPDFRRVLSIKQPWAFLILRPDLVAGSQERAAWEQSAMRKDVENRTWNTHYRGRIWIHASKEFDLDAAHSLSLQFPEFNETFGDPGSLAYVRGGIIGHVELDAVVQRTSSMWHIPGHYGFMLEKPVCTPFEPLRGMPGIFRAGDSLFSKNKKTS